MEDPKGSIAHAYMQDIPYELFLQIFSHLTDDRDIFNLILTTRQLYIMFINDDHIYRLLSSRVVPDISIITTHFRHTIPPSSHYKRIYTSLLYTYGPLLGLWASDIPFRGNVMEFRIVDVRKYGWEGIIGEVWRFPRTNVAENALIGFEDRNIPKMPEYWETVRFELEEGEVKEDGEVNRTPCNPATVKWNGWKDRSDSDTQPREDRIPTLRYYNRIQYGVWVSNVFPDAGELLTVHPDFPSIHASTSVWYDSTRPPLHLIPQSPGSIPSLDKDQYNFRYRRPHFIVSGSTPDATLKPPCISIYRPRGPPWRDNIEDELHNFPIVGIDDLRDQKDCPHYFPLRFPWHLPPQDSSSKKSFVSSLEGIWLTACGLYGTEVHFLSYDPDEDQVNAWKITGDINVSRGALAWTMDTSLQLAPNADDLNVFGRLGQISPNTMIYKGEGITGGRCFLPRERGKKVITIAVIGQHEMRIRWGHAQHSTKTVHYRPRDHESEIREGGKASATTPWPEVLPPNFDE
ncbi:hypothetical protein C8Q75DRAFT_510013 [Abortiporus biennis]|nr:hypothetical protein C8Q75DRAFT_510013 [Abortiporus biennis]